MAVVHGRKGTVTISYSNQEIASASAGLIDRWTGNLNRDTFESTVFDTTRTSKDRVAGDHDFTGSIEGYLDSGDLIDLTRLQADTQSAQLKLYTYKPGGAADKVYTFNAILNSIQFGAQVGALNRFTANFESDGDISEATE